MLTEQQRFLASLAAHVAGAMVGDQFCLLSQKDIVSTSVDYAIMICEEISKRDTAPPVAMPSPTRTPGAGVERKG